MSKDMEDYYKQLEKQQWSTTEGERRCTRCGSTIFENPIVFRRMQKDKYTDKWIEQEPIILCKRCSDAHDYFIYHTRWY